MYTFFHITQENSETCALMCKDSIRFNFFELNLLQNYNLVGMTILVEQQSKHLIGHNMFVIRFYT